LALEGSSRTFDRHLPINGAWPALNLNLTLNGSPARTGDRRIPLDRLAKHRRSGYAPKGPDSE
jgi:hypothetical protein